jgi:hypothetical protein
MKKGTREDIRMVVALVIIGGVAVYWMQRRVSQAVDGAIDSFTAPFSAAWNGIGDALSSAGSAIADVGHGTARFLGTQGQIDPVTGGYVPFGAIPNPTPGTAYNLPWYLGGGSSDLFDAQGNYRGGAFGSTVVRQAEQADVRRLDNAIDAGTYSAPTKWSGFFPNYVL